MTLATYNNPAQSTNVHYLHALLKHAGPNTVLEKFAKPFTLPKHSSDTLSMDRLVPFGFDDTEATEGVVPEAVGMDYENIQFVIKEYEHLARVSSKKWELSEQDAVNDAATLQGEFIINVNELLCWNELITGTVVFYDTAAHTARTSVDTAITLGRLRKMSRALDTAKARTIRKINRGGNNEGTVPSEPAFIGLCHTEMKADVRNIPGFITAAEIGSGTLPPNAFGQVEDIIFVMTQQLFPIIGGGATQDGSKINDGSKNDVYPLVIIGQEAFGSCILQGYASMKPNIMTGPVKGADPTGKFVDIATRWYRDDKILNETWLARGEFAVTLNP